MEYLVLIGSSDVGKFMLKLNEMAKEGWRIVTATESPMGNVGTSRTVYLSRETPRTGGKDA